MPRELFVRAAERSAQTTASSRDPLRDRLRDWIQNWPPEHLGGIERQRIEIIVARSRLLLATTVLVAAAVAPTLVALLGDFVYALSAGYFAFSIGVLVTFRRRMPSRLVVRVIQALDMLFAIALIGVTGGPSSPFFILLLFGALFSSIRGGMAEAIVTATVTLSALVAIGIIAHWQFWPSQYWPPFHELERFILRASYLSIAPILIGYLAEGRRRLYVEHTIVGTFLRLGRSATGLDETLARIFQELFAIFPAREMLLAVQDSGRGRAWLRRFQQQAETPGGTMLQTPRIDLRESEWPVYFGPRSGPCWQQSIDRLDPLFERHGCTTLVGCDVALGADIYARVLILDPLHAPLGRRRIHLLKSIVVQLGPSILSKYLFERLESNATRRERTKLAHELHDGITQSLLGLELEIESYVRKPGDANENLRRLRFIRDRIHTSVLDLRDFMGELRMSGATPDSLPIAIRQSAARLRRETGIVVEIHGLDQLEENDRQVIEEISRFVHEALVNVRKHADASQVQIAYQKDDRFSRLTIEDNGKGFGFRGTLSGQDLKNYEDQPAMLLARAQAAGGMLTLHSDPGLGARVELAWPLEKVTVARMPDHGPSPDMASARKEVLKYRPKVLLNIGKESSPT